MRVCSLSLALRPPPTSTLFPYTTLFRSEREWMLELPTKERRRIREALAQIARGLTATSQIGDAEARSGAVIGDIDRKSTRLNSSHPSISYAVFCLKKKTWSSPTTPPPGR